MQHKVISAGCSWVPALVALFVGLGPAVATARSFDTTQSCAKLEYAAGPDTGNAPPVTPGESTLKVVPGYSTPDHKLNLTTTTYIGMGRQVTVCIKGLHDWLYVPGHNPSSLRLSIGGHILSNVPPSGIGPPSQEYLNFVLHLDASDTEDWKAWAAIVDASRHDGPERMALITVASGDNKEFFDSTAYSTVVTSSESWYWILPSFVVMIATLVYLGGTSDLLRYTLGEQPTLPERSPYSLGLVQMAFWFCLSLGAYIYICLMTKQAHVPMGSVLGLLGISATTGLTAVLVDKRKGAATDNLEAERAALTARVKDLASTATGGPAAETDLLQKKTRLAQVEAQLAQAPSDTLPATSKGFFNDVLSDGENVSFHRFQMVIWTIVLGCIFVWSVYRNMSMPEFDASLLTLMGISSGTYVGFKFPEKLKTGGPAGNAPAAGTTL